jgi:hypothetical protein
MVDRITGMTMGAPPVLELGWDQNASIIQSELSKGAEKPTLWLARTQEGAQTWFWGYFDGRPSPEASGALFADMLRGKVKSISGYRSDSRTISISVPSEKPAPAK